MSLDALDGFVCASYLRPASSHPMRVLTRNRAAELTQIFSELTLKNGVPAMKFRPLQDRVVVKRVEEESKTAGGIIIPDTAKEKPQEAEVVAVGPGARDDKGALIAMDVKVGDRVLFGKWSGTEITLEGQDLLIMKESDILGVVG
jgi:chaperonin GroES